MKINRKKHSRTLEIIAGFLTVVFLCSFFPVKLLFADESKNTEDIRQESSDQPGNPVEGLLDPSPSGLIEPDANGYLVYDALSDTMLIGKDYESQMEPASITQIMTVLLALENLQLSDKITFKPSMYETIPRDFVRIGFEEGEIVTVEECLYSCILKSANDACMALAIEMAGSEKSFVDLMNKRAMELGCTHTHFSNPYGKSDYDHYSTCHDLALILKEVLNHPTYISIATSLSYTMEPTNKYNDKRILNNGNRYISSPQLAYEYYIGGKTGYTEGLGYTIIAGAEKEGKRLVGVMMRASDAEKRYSEMMELLEYCFSKYTTTKIEDSEFSDPEKTTISQIQSALEGTDLRIDSINITSLKYYSVPLSLTDSGYSTVVDLSKVTISPQLSEQTVVVPVDRVFSNETRYRIGYISIQIVNSTVKEDTKKDTKDASTFSIVNMIIVSFVGLLLLFLTVFAISLFIKITRKRKLRKNHRNPTVL